MIVIKRNNRCFSISLISGGCNGEPLTNRTVYVRECKQTSKNFDNGTFEPFGRVEAESYHSETELSPELFNSALDKAIDKLTLKIEPFKIDKIA